MPGAISNAADRSEYVWSSLILSYINVDICLSEFLSKLECFCT
jgi:hypothetical protein